MKLCIFGIEAVLCLNFHVLYTSPPQMNVKPQDLYSVESGVRLVFRFWILVNICWHRNAGRWKCYKCSVWCLQCVAGCEGPMRAVPVCEAPPTEDRRVWRPVSVLLQSPHHPTGLTTGRGLIKLSYTNKWYRGHTLLQCGWKQQEKVQATGWRELLVEIKQNHILLILSCPLFTIVP